MIVCVILDLMPDQLSFLTSKWFWLGFLLFLTVLLHRWFLYPGDWRTHDGIHFIRLHDLDIILKQGQIPPRWVPNYGKGYGYPLFNFYPPLAYFVGEVFYLLGFSITQANKLSFLSAGLVGVAGMFFLAKKMLDWPAAVGSGLLWLFLPYRAVSLYVRGSLAEYWGMNLLPWLFYVFFRFVKRKSQKNFLLLALVWFILLITHNIVALLASLALAGLFIADFLFRKTNRSWQYWFWPAGAAVLAFSLAAFFVLPALWEQRLTKIGGMVSNYYSFQNHFPSLHQMFIARDWGYGGSNFGTVDGMSFQVGYLQWILPLLAIVGLAAKWKIAGLSKIEQWLAVLVVGWGGFLFLDHQRSIFLWRLIPILPIIQFPWRLLLFSGFLGCLVGGWVYYQVSRRVPQWQIPLILLTTLALFWLNFRYFQPRQLEPIGDQDYLSGELWDYQRREFVKDYLPKTVEQLPDYYNPPRVIPAKGTAEIIEQEADYFHLQTRSPEPTHLTLKQFYFPGWQATVDGRLVEITPDVNGFITFPVPFGKHEAEIKLTDTPVRRVGNWLSLIGGTELLLLAVIPAEKLPFFSDDDQ